MATLRDQAARRRLELNPIRTSLNVVQQPYHLQTPSSALSSTSLSAPFSYSSANTSYTPVSSVQQYNPQQWTASPNITPDSGSRFSPSQHRDAEVIAPAPPPYSPPRSQRSSLIEDPSSGISPATRASPSIGYRASPEPSSNPVFPPPPMTTRTRAGSSDRPLSIFGISAFSRRGGSDAAQVSSPESSRPHAPAPRRPLPITVPISVEAPSSESEHSQSDARPPASRRAASAGAISTPSSSRSRGSSTARWEPGMPLPPPPPGPPPQPRSQSMSRSNDRVVSPPTRRPGPLSTLGPVPPTPAGWVDGEDMNRPGRGRSPHPGLQIDTSSVSSSMHNPESNSGSSTSGLSRTPARRGEPKSIRERRNESKTRRAISDAASNNPWAEAITPADIVVPPTSILGHRPMVSRATPGSGRSQPGQTPNSADESQQHTPVPAVQTAGSKGSTPRPLQSSSRPEAPTPPFSPGQIRQAFIESPPPIPPKGLPTPPPQRLAAGSPARPISHILHIPNDDTAVVAPLVPSRPGSRPGSRQASRERGFPTDQFARAAIERHQSFIKKEAAAATDEERVRIFAEFIVTESRIRRDKYATAIDAMGSEILELTRDLFRPYNASSRRESNVSRSSGWTPESSTGPRSPIPLALRSHRGSLSAALHEGVPPINTEPPSSGSMPGSPIVTTRPESTWWTGYMPSLSPIPSMSVSEAPDGSDSRGRPSSRWWEVSQEGSTGTPSMRLERSKRESKYMGMPKELREALQNGEIASPTQPVGPSFGDAGPSTSQSYGPNEYPPEKTGWHDQDPSSPPLIQTPGKGPAPFSPALLTPNPAHLDVSRLVTLPPPYPRHHPAVNNNHPDLSSIRTHVRTLSDLSEVEATKARFLASSTQIANDLAASASNRRSTLRTNIQREIASGSMSFADAAKIEAEADLDEAEKTKAASKEEFELFQTTVVIPLNDLLMDRVHKATELFDQLRGKLFVDAQEQSPNLTQEEGDEQPELLEKLTLLKWIFEARESLHRELFDLLTDRNDRYKEMVITPYRLAGNIEKTKHAEKFFADDAGKRKLAFASEILKRTEEFMDIIESNVIRGVEVQLSAFWDIAPPLSTILSKIPSDLNGFQIQIPAKEYEENPSYFEFPMQYLYSLLGHCEKSSYQFIESQVNLLCLLHEVKGMVTGANCRVMREQRVGNGEGEETVGDELKRVEGEEGERLTDDLKERVRCVEELWGGALGRELEDVRGRVREFLVGKGGWDDESSL